MCKLQGRTTDIRQVWKRVEGWMRWSSGGCETLLGPNPMSLTRVPWILVKSPAAEAVSCDVVAGLPLRHQR